MAIHRLAQLFNPRRIALVGVTPNPESVGGKLLLNLVGGFKGVVYPVNPTAEAVLGIPCFPALASLPRAPDLGVICAAAEQVPDLVRQCGEAGILAVVVVSAGFREAGPAGRALEDRVAAERRRFPGMRILGPNCLGFLVPRLGLNVSFAGGLPRDGDIAFISQSGALCSSVLDWALAENVGFSHFVSIGNSLDIDFGDLIDYFGEDERTKSIVLYLESVADARKFLTAARAFARTKPIVAYKAGRFPESAAAAASHTGALASSDDVYAAAFQRAGIARLARIGDIFDVVDLIGRKKMPRGRRLAIVTNAGGPGVIATDALIAAGGVLAQLSAETLAELDENLPPQWSRRNPVDVLGDARSKRVAKAVEIVARDKGVDAILIIVTPQAMTNPGAIAKALARVGEDTRKPLLAAFLGGRTMTEGVEILNQAGVATFATPEQAVQAFMTLMDYASNLEILYETPREIPVRFPVPRAECRERFARLVAGSGTCLGEDVSKSLLAGYGIPTADAIPAGSADAAVAAADRIGYPVVLKILSPDITHKTDVGGVALDLADADAVRAAFGRVVAAARGRAPSARIAGVTVQPMIRSQGAVELILGARKDPVFGSVIMVGLGGIAAELFEDRAIGFPPLNERLARRMLESLKIWPLLSGYRGRPPLAVEALLEVLFRLSYLVADFPEVEELDINPLLVCADRVVALDARVILDPTPRPANADPYAHLALRPYPEEYVRPITLDDGTPVVLRPIKPEDEPLWLELLRGCSPESLYQRFRYLFHWETHEIATRFCFIDYDREIAIVAEAELDGRRTLMAVGRLIADPDLETVEFAILVGDRWQDQGLGGVLTDYCLEVSRRWGLRRVVAQTTRDNQRMLAIFERRGFVRDDAGAGADVNLVKELAPPRPS
ncbi:MAG TPA: GNAT family N-acetyltransferase [Candidatus Krumholzibacteria bacterium]|nr:GNAT family N-acetyltransferase [Candidatus Krumholzibacteria bacterium]HPD71104.1 GNAT family N-acetyltransferase [Candidatus Krumholzibacteria bacterium]HRY39196.1 GNAT family N-acetyltransferase [Candidatus Krumholzibacteria bacterium]